MHPDIAALFQEAESRYLKPEELTSLSQYVESLPERLETYRKLQEKELEILQEVADLLQEKMPQEEISNLERSIKNAVLVLRYCATAMLLNNELFLKERLLDWLQSTQKIHDSKTIDNSLYKLLNSQLSQSLTPKQMKLLNPLLTLAEKTLLAD